jgi:hypothetical protein
MRHGDFKKVERYCFFVGYARSGHSLIGSLLNAHPEMVISNELNAMRFVKKRIPRDPLYGLIWARDQFFGSRGRQWTGYDYNVPNQFQGRYTKLRVIGDKKGAATTRSLRQDPWILEKLRKVVHVPLRVVHVTRNPFDNIARMRLSGRTSLETVIQRYTELCETVEVTRTRLASDELIDVRFEEFSELPSDWLARICKFLGTEADPRFLADCSAIVAPPSSRARDQITWEREDIQKVSDLISRFEILQGYSFD